MRLLAHPDVRGTLAALRSNGAQVVAVGALLVLGTQAERFSIGVVLSWVTT